MLEPSSKDKYVMKGFDRIRGDNAEPDFEVTIVRQTAGTGEADVQATLTDCMERTLIMIFQKKLKILFVLLNNS